MINSMDKNHDTIPKGWIRLTNEDGSKTIECPVCSERYDFDNNNLLFGKLLSLPNYCPKCGKRIYRRTDIILLCYPPKHRYFCSKCDWTGCA